MSLLVVTATRGECAHLAQTVRSVAALRSGKRHLLVCPASASSPLAARFPESEIAIEEGGGLYAALNSARAEAAEAEFVTWINDDDTLDAGGIERSLELMRRTPGVAAVYGRVGLIDGESEGLGELPVARRAEDLVALLAAGVMPLAQPGTVLRRECMDALTWFDASYRLAGDLDLFARALRAGSRFAFQNSRVASFRLHAGQLSKDEARARMEHARAVAGLAVAEGEGRAALRRFRWDNRWVYLRRVLRHGPRRMASLYRHA